MKNILLIEDEEKIRFVIEKFLIKEDFNVYQAGTGGEGLDLYYENKIDLIILDLMLPDMSGYEVCKEIKEQYDTPIIMLTAMSQDEDEIKGLNYGADDYMKKPYNIEILKLRIHNLLKMDSEKIIKDELFELDFKSLKVKFKGKEIKIPLKEIELLEHFIKNKGIVLNRDQILDSVWGNNFFGDHRTVDTHIKILRKKFGKNIIETYRGLGYKYIGDVNNENK